MKNFALIGWLLSAVLTLASNNVFAYEHYRSRYNDDQRSERYDRCRSCGTVERIEYAGHGKNSGGGAVAGVVIGGVLGNQVGDGDGRRAATVAGAVIGGIVGNNAERRSSRRRNVYDVLVNMDRGQSIWVTQGELRGVREGSRVEVRGGRVYLR